MNRRFDRALKGVASFVLIAASAACIGFRGPVDLEREVERRTDSRLERDFALSVGPATMALARRFVDDEDVPIEGVRSLQVGVYHRGPADRGERLDRHLEPRDFPALSLIVRVREDDEHVLVLAEMDGERMRKMIVVVGDLDEVVIVRMKGRLERIVEQAIRAALGEADRDDLADPTVEAWRDGEPRGENGDRA